MSTTRKLNLCLHCGGDYVERAAIDQVITPNATSTWQPISHQSLLERTFEGLAASGYKVVNEAHALARDGNRYFGLLQLEPEQESVLNDEYGLILGVRNSHDKAFPAAYALGTQVFVCDNLSINAEIQLSRRHTRFINRDLPGVISRACGLLSARYTDNSRRFETYKRFALAPRDAHDIIVRAFDAGAVCGSSIGKVLQEFRELSHVEFQGETCWTLHNAFTEVLKGSSLHQLPKRTTALNGILDSHCGITPLALSN